MRKLSVHNVTVRCRYNGATWRGCFLEAPSILDVSDALTVEILELDAIEANTEDDQDAEAAEESERLHDNANELRVMREVAVAAEGFGEVLVAHCKIGSVEVEDGEAFTVR